MHLPSAGEFHNSMLTRLLISSRLLCSKVCFNLSPDKVPRYLLLLGEGGAVAEWSKVLRLSQLEREKN